jgi:hypothetical protein
MMRDLREGLGHEMKIFWRPVNLLNISAVTGIFCTVHVQCFYNFYANVLLRDIKYKVSASYFENTYWY